MMINNMTNAMLMKILYVEDDADIQSVTKIALELIGGFILLTCSSGREALDAATLEFAPNLLLLDVMMPDMDGPTTLKHLRQHAELADTPVIFMTAKVQDNEIDYYRSLGAIGYIAKPFDPMTLAAQVRQLWNESLARE